MVNTIADVTVAATRAALSSTSVRAAWVNIQASKSGGNSAVVRVGDVNVTTARGGIVPVAIGSSLLLPPCGNANAYDLNGIYVIGTANDTISVIYETI